MAASPETDDVQAVLARLSISAPAGDLPFLQRTLEKQRALVASWRARVPTVTDPALVLRVQRAAAGPAG